jgi:hypothetical protein
MDIVRPTKITSPISGQPSTPKIVEARVGDKIYVEAHWYDPASGAFIRKGLVKILDSVSREDVTSTALNG